MYIYLFFHTDVIDITTLIKINIFIVNCLSWLSKQFLIFEFRFTYRFSLVADDAYSKLENQSLGENGKTHVVRLN